MNTEIQSCPAPRPMAACELRAGGPARSFAGHAPIHELLGNLFLVRRFFFGGRSPSPRPSPAGRGSHVGCAGDERGRPAWLRDGPADPLSRRERARVRGSAPRPSSLRIVLREPPNPLLKRCRSRGNGAQIPRQSGSLFENPFSVVAADVSRLQFHLETAARARSQSRLTSAATIIQTGSETSYVVGAPNSSSACAVGAGVVGSSRIGFRRSGDMGATPGHRPWDSPHVVSYSIERAGTDL